MKLMDVMWILFIIMMLAMFTQKCESEEFTDTQICNAIYLAEGGAKADFLYGIRSVRYDTPEEARRICMNTIRNNRVRFLKQTEYTDYLEFLQSRYCPTKGKLSKAEQKGNGFWLKNVRYFLEKNK